MESGGAVDRSMTEDEIQAHLKAAADSLERVVVSGAMTMSGFTYMVEREFMSRVLQKFRWNKNVSAKYVGMQRTTLVERIKKWGLVKEKGAAASLRDPLN